MTANFWSFGDKRMISCVIRFLCNLPLALYAFPGLPYHHYFRNNMEALLAPPLGKEIFVGEVLSGPIGVISFFGNILILTPSYYASGGALFSLGVIDTIILGSFIAALRIEASYIGFTSAQCAELKPNATSTSNLVFFQRLAKIETKFENFGERSCQEFKEKWYAGLVVAILYALLAATNIIIGSISLIHYGDYRSSYNRNTRSLRDWLLLPYTLVATFVTGLAGCLYSIMPKRAQRALLFASRYTRHWFYYKSSRTKHKIRDVYTLSPRAHCTDGKDKALADVLTNVEQKGVVIEWIAPKLHYVDLVNLSLTSRRIREAVFPRQQGSTGDERQLRYYSCWGNEKYDCWACEIQICNECSKSKQCTNSTVSFHMSLCAATCSKCYYETSLRAYEMKRPCECRDGRRKDYTGWHLGAQANAAARRLVCTNCHVMTANELSVLKERHDNAVYSKLTQQPLSCSVCLEALPRTGLRWWVCSKCKRECRSNCHLAWSQS
ncbi:hypothetical protein HD806DRAFT_179665 [Xylariaceae sp. AK1471]|nr:hypothetical protein HD806DRAFT_179665 [Xylariaceae sp. AK1471]